MSAAVTTSQWRNVEVGRVVLFSAGPYAGRLAAIVEIIDHKRVLVDGPASKPEAVVPRHSVSLAYVSLTPVVIEKLPRASGNGAVRAAWEKAGVEKTWENSAWAKNRSQSALRKNLNDFERFKVMRLRKQARFEVRKTVAASRATAKA